MTSPDAVVEAITHMASMNVLSFGCSSCAIQLPGGESPEIV